MKLLSIMMAFFLALFLLCGCTSSDEDPVEPVDPNAAVGIFTNVLVGDGTVDTRMSVRNNNDTEDVASGILPNVTTVDNDILLGGTQDTARLGILLTAGPGTILNVREPITLTIDVTYSYVACGHIDAVDGDLQPKFLMLDPLSTPGVGKAQFRLVHALAGNPIPVDVHVNGEVIANVAYGTQSPAVVFDTRPLGQDDLTIVPTGVTPDGTNEIWKSSGQILFAMNSHTDGVLAHYARSAYEGDVAGEAIVVFVE